MSPMLPVLGALVVGAALVAVTRRNLVHAALWLVACLVGVAALFLHLGAGFLGWVQMLVYVGAVAVLIVFAVLLTRGGDPETDDPDAPASGARGRRWGGAIAAAFLGLVLLSTARQPPRPADPSTPPPAVSAQSVGHRLVGDLVLPLQVIGLLLTAALVGAVVLALPRRADEAGDGGPADRGEGDGR